MIAAFPAPVLSVTADAVRDLEGGEALSSLWTRESYSDFLNKLTVHLIHFCFFHVDQSSRSAKNHSKMVGASKIYRGVSGTANWRPNRHIVP